MEHVLNMHITTAIEKSQRIRNDMDKVLFGQDHIKDQLLACFLSGGHVLIEGVPGTGKTQLAMALSHLTSCSFSRIQFTPEIGSADLLGQNIYHPELEDYQFHAGPIFTDIFMGDEINRTPPQTQAALLEAMQEKTISVGGTQQQLSKIFFVMATQNPVEYEATFPLPEAQRDRFQMRVDIGFPNEAEEKAIVDSYADGVRLHDQILQELEPVVSLLEMYDIRYIAKHKVDVPEDIRNTIVKVINTSREDARIKIGASSRGSIALLDSSRAFALMRGRDHVTCQDLADSIVPTLIHRVVMANGESAEPLLERVAEHVARNEGFLRGSV